MNTIATTPNDRRIAERTVIIESESDDSGDDCRGRREERRAA
ncbi:hypothetical protein [Halococcus thailandensis]|nr:hypothetical protein [Halococcus thailandensis]